MTSLVGVVVYDAVTDTRDTIRFLNDDGTLWYKFTFYYDDSDGKWDFPNEEFKPLAFHPDFFLLRLGVVSRDSLGYEVVVNKATGATRRLPSAPFLQFKTWEEHILTAFSVRFDTAANPLRAAPNDSSAFVAYPSQADYFKPLEVTGDWVKVTWGERESRSTSKTGWVRWRREARLVVDLFYFA